MPPPRSRAEVQHQKDKLASSYHELLEEFSSKDLRNVGNYNLGRLIGKGSFGKVYLATHKLTNGSKVVLKSSDKEDGNLAREIHHHRQFLHPHIARLYEVIVTEKLVWLVLEYCPGDELYNYLLRNGPIAVDKVQKIFTQLVGAVAYVHGKSCVHRDLKLENILLDKNENVKLCDFGFTREYEGKANYLQTFCGTICYSAPEMLKGEKYAGEKVDVWSLGIILYALIAGELPFDEDDDQDTKRRILTEDPKFNDRFPEDAKSLITLLLSKRPLIRPTLADILAHPFLAEHAPTQQAILKLARPSPFTTPLEKTTLERMKSAGVNIDQVIENVLAQRCDSLAGWWALLIEKEERKEKRRERKRREREAEAKNLRRLSAASSRLEHISAALMEVDEEGHSPAMEDELRSRGRRDRRSLPTPQIVVPELPKLPETATVQSPESMLPPPPVEKDSVRSSISSQPRPVPPPKENRKSHTSTLQLSTSTPDLLRPNGIFRRRTRRQNPHPFISQLASLKHWFIESAKRARSPHGRAGGNTGNQSRFHTNKSSPPKNPTQLNKSATTPTNPSFNRTHQTHTQTKRASNASSLTPSNTSNPHQPRSSSLSGRPRPLSTTNSHHRNSLSPSALTPRSSYRRSSAGLRGRKSTSSSVSSIRSIHHAHSHSKASSASSNSMDTVSTPTGSSAKNLSLSRSPHNSLKVLPTTPNASSRFPNNIRVVRGLNNAASDGREYGGRGTSGFNEKAPIMSSPSSGLVFARRKRSAFKGPMLGAPNPLFGGGLGTPRSREGSVGREGAEARPGTRKSQIIEEEEDEMMDDDDEYEDVDRFSPTDDKEMDFEEARESLDELAQKVEEETGLVTPVTATEEPTKPVFTPSPEPNVDPLRPPRSSSLAENRPPTGDISFLPPAEVESIVVTTTVPATDDQETSKPLEKD